MESLEGVYEGFTRVQELLRRNSCHESVERRVGKRCAEDTKQVHNQRSRQMEQKTVGVRRLRRVFYELVECLYVLMFHGPA